LPHQAFALQIGQNHRLQLFCATSFAHFHRFSKNLLCPSSRTKPASFCPISPEAYLLTGRNKGWKNFPSLFPPQAKRGMSMRLIGRISTLDPPDVSLIFRIFIHQTARFVFSGDKRAVWLRENKAKNRSFGR